MSDLNSILKYKRRLFQQSCVHKFVTIHVSFLSVKIKTMRKSLLSLLIADAGWSELRVTVQLNGDKVKWSRVDCDVVL